MKIIATLLVSACVIAPAYGQTAEYNGEFARGPAPPTDQIIVKWRTDPAASAGSTSRVQKLTSATSRQLQLKSRITQSTEVLKLDHPLARGELDEVLSRIAAEPDVEYAVADRRARAHAVPNDPLFTQQWYLQSTEAAATRTEQAWDVTTGSGATVVAVLDTGVRFDHPDLGRLAAAGKLLDGYDFVTDPAIANDGDGTPTDSKDSDASDPGDWLSAADRLQPGFSSCEERNSSWHGTRVSSLIGALANDMTGMAGKGWSTVILPVRVLGKCGGHDSDIIAGMRWATGLNVVGVPINANPAKVINISLGSDGACSAAYQSTISEITARGTVVIVSAGNDGGPISAPANCAGALAVTGMRHAGTKVGYSNLGTQAGLGAPAGNCVNTASGAPCLFSVLAATNTGSTTPLASTWTDHGPSDNNADGDVSDFNVGTSFSAPLVAGAAALMHSVNAQLSPPQYITLLRETAMPFATSSVTTTTVCHVPASAADVQNQECICTTQTCGSGMLNTRAAVVAARNPFAISQAPASVTPATNVTIDGRGSFASNGRTISTYQWSAVSVTGAAPVFADASQALTTLQVSGSSQFTLRLTITDDQGAQDTADVAMATPAPPPTTPPTSQPTGGGGGGGNFGTLLLGLIVLPLIRGYCPKPTSRRRSHY